MKHKKKEILAVALLAIILSAAGCSKENNDNGGDFDVKVFSVAGKVLDASTLAELQDVTVTMTAYHINDTAKSDPVFSAVYNTLPDGTYKFFNIWEGSSPEVYYVFKVVDESDLREVHYKPAERELYMSASSPFFNHSAKSYEVTGNDFYLVR